MKLCSKCGAHNADERQYCVDCAKRLGEPLSAEEEAKVTAKIRSTIHRLYKDDENQLRVTALDKTLVVLTAVLAIISAAFGVLFLCTGQRWLYGFSGVIAVPVSVFFCLKPHLYLQMERLYFRCRYDFFPSQFEWDKLSVNGILFARRCTAIVMALSMGAVMAAAIHQFRHPPVVSYVTDIYMEALNSTVQDEHAGIVLPQPKEEIYAYVVTEKPVKWQILLNRGAYTVEVLVEHLEDSIFVPGYAWLEMLTITEITGMEFKESYLECSAADAFLQDYYAFIEI